MHDLPHPSDPGSPPPSVPGPMGPVREGERIVTIDVLRGFALLGIFLVNVQFFALPLMHGGGLEHPGLAAAPLVDRLAWCFVKAFCEFKFISLFSLLFGIGLVIQSQRAAARGRPLAPTYLRRLAILAGIGLAHGLLLWYGDILFIYAVAGLALLAVHRLRAATLLRIAAALIVVHIVLSAGCSTLMKVSTDLQAEAMAAGTAPTADAPDAAPPAGFAAMAAAQFDPSRDVWIDAEIRAYRDGPFADAFAFRSVSYAYALLFAVFGFGWRVLAMFLLGAGLMKLELFAPSRRAWQRRLCLVGLGVGVPLELGVAATSVAAGFTFTWPVLLANVVHEIASVFLALGYLGLVCLLVRPGAGGLVQRLFAAGGRLALSVYLLETIVTTGVMYWWGLGRFDSMARSTLLLYAVGVYAGLLVGALAWLRVFRIGPFEWMWRSLTYLRPQPLLRRGG